MDEAGDTGAILRHRAFFYRTIDEYVSAVADFLLAEDAAAQPALIAVPSARHARLRRALGPRLGSAPLTFANMAELGRNPGRIIPAIQAFINDSAGKLVRFVGEPIWPGRSAAEIREATRHEALINLAFAGTPVTLLCPYDIARLPGRVITNARRTHPVLAAPRASRRRADLRSADRRSRAYARSGRVPDDCDAPLPVVPTDATVVQYRSNMRAVRDLIGEHAELAGLTEARAVDFVLAVSEVAANTLRHTGSGGTMSIWRAEGELICQVHDTGHIADPLAGRRAPDSDHPGGHGLWLVHQVCDLVELRSGQQGTTVRMHMRLPRTLRKPPNKAPRPLLAGNGSFPDNMTL